MGGQVEETLEQLIERGWVVRQGETYALTPLGREETGKAVAGMRRTFVHGGATFASTDNIEGLFRRAFRVSGAQTARRTSFGQCGVAQRCGRHTPRRRFQLLVYAGLHFGKERAINVILVLLMLGTGGVTLYEAIQRFFVSLEPEVNWFSFLAAILSAAASPCSTSANALSGRAAEASRLSPSRWIHVTTLSSGSALPQGWLPRRSL